MERPDGSVQVHVLTRDAMVNQRVALLCRQKGTGTTTTEPRSWTVVRGACFSDGKYRFETGKCDSNHTHGIVKVVGQEHTIKIDAASNRYGWIRTPHLQHHSSQQPINNSKYRLPLMWDISLSSEHTAVKMGIEFLSLTSTNRTSGSRVSGCLMQVSCGSRQIQTFFVNSTTTLSEQNILPLYRNLSSLKNQRPLLTMPTFKLLW